MKDEIGRPSLPVGFKEFRAACQAELLKSGVTDAKFAIYRNTHEPVIIVNAEHANIKAQQLYDALYGLADKYDISAAVVPASAVVGAASDLYRVIK